MDINLQKRNGEMIPIGSGIAESGEGYIRFSDGTQICYGAISNAYCGTIIWYPKAFSAMPYATFSYINNDYITDKNMIYLFHVSSGGATDDENFTILTALALRIQFISIKTKLATADLGGHKHDIETQISNYTEYVKSNLQGATLKGIYVEYIAIGRWK